MIHKFQYYREVKEFLYANPAAKLVGWPAGVKRQHYTVLLPNPTRRNNESQTASTDR